MAEVRQAYADLRARGFACGCPVPPFEEVFPGTRTCGYARRRGEGGEDDFYCLPCAYERERADLKTALKYTAYLSLQERGGRAWYVTTWPGERLAEVTSIRRSVKHTWAGLKPWLYFRAVDLHGQAWIGQGEGEGTYCRLRRARGRA